MIYQIWVAVPSVLVTVVAEDEASARTLALENAPHELHSVLKYWPEEDDIEGVENIQEEG